MQVAGTYQFTAPTLADGTYTEQGAISDVGRGRTAQSTTTYTINTDGPHVTAMSPDSAVGTSVSQVTVTFSEPIDLNTFTPSAITLNGPGGLIAVNQPQLVSGDTYTIGFANPDGMQGSYSLTIAPSVSDIAGNEMDQNQNGVNGEPDDSFTGSFTIALPDLAVTATQAPSSALLGASIPVSWTVTNVSPTNPAPSTWTDAVYISPDSVLERRGHPLDQRRCARPVAARAAGRATRATSRSPFRATLAIGERFSPLRGQRQRRPARVRRWATRPTTSSPCRSRVVAPDLQVTGLNVQPSNPVSGSTLIVGWNDANTGDAATSTGWVDSVSIVNTSTNQTLVTAAVPYDANSLGALEPGGSAAQQCILRLPDGDPGVGNLTITVTTNADNSVIEGNSAGTAGSNNTASTDVASTLARLRRPDRRRGLAGGHAGDPAVGRIR